MKFSTRMFNLVVVASGVGILATTVVESSMSIRGNSKTANKLMTFSRRLEDGGQQNYGNNNNYQGGYSNNNQNQNQNQNQNGEQANNYQGGYGNNNNYNGANNNGGGGGQNGQYGGQYGQYGGQYGQQDGGGGEESMYFLNNYSIKLLSCIQGEQIVNYENGEMESSTVVFRLCPSDSCDANSELGCESGYGDYTVGITTFLEAYMESQEDNQNYYGNGMITYNNYGQEFDAEEYMECREYDVEEGQQQNNYNGQYNNNNNNNGQQQQQQNSYNQYNNNNGQQQNNNNQYNNGQRRQLQNNYYYNAQYFIGPGCSADGTTIVLGMYADEYCSYPSDVNFADIAYGWESGLPFSDGGLVSMNCVACYGPDQDYNYELSEMCTESYEFSSSRCESNMESNSYYYGQNTQGCDYIDSLVESVYGNGNDDVDGTDNNSTSTDSWVTSAVSEVSTRFMDTLSTREARSFIAAMVLFSLSAFFGATLMGYFCVQKRKKAKLRATKGLLPEAEQPMESRRRSASVVALVRSGTNGIAESVRTATTGVRNAAARSVASVRTRKSSKKKEEADSAAETPKVVYTDMNNLPDVVEDEEGNKDAGINVIF